MSNQRKTRVKKLPQILNKYTAHLRDSKGEINNEPSLTIQGEAINIKEFVKTRAFGDLPPMALSAYDGYDPDIDMDVTPRYSTDLHDINESLQIQAEILENQKLILAEQEQQKQEFAEKENEAKNDLNEKAEEKEIA